MRCFCMTTVAGLIRFN
uniref:Uncharacterized protein n=1 Tax=Anguilla anguilla TaxID=7936 RepID=A0A0E9UWT0_ANGAN